MNAAATPDLAPAQPAGNGWSAGRMLWLIVFIFAVHVILIFIFGARKPEAPRPVKSPPQLQFASPDNELIALTDPTLFALPHADEYTPPLKMADYINDSFQWPKNPQSLSLSPTLGGTLAAPKVNISPSRTPLDFKPPPKFTASELQFGPVSAERSAIRLGGSLAQRQLITRPQLPSWPDNDVLPPSVVQVLVDADGNVVSDVLLKSSGLDAADQGALNFALGAHFAPAPSSVVGQMVFLWHTVASATNALPAQP